MNRKVSPNYGIKISSISMFELLRLEKNYFCKEFAVKNEKVFIPTEVRKNALNIKPAKVVFFFKNPCCQ
ncbi:hypothetical protein DP120_01580 [Planococcus halotolerans]|uniref:Uncharacterized protein n=1 Tax=Planococcus halotolerans TaxID=2233542 RepID=A0A365L6G5_9BACL|nr:hypothetical protein DP120_01580 [Planococcus halotolerans]